MGDASGTTWVDDVTLLADVAHVDGRSACHEPVLGRHAPAQVGKGVAVLGVVCHRAVLVLQLLLDLFDASVRNLEHVERRSKVDGVVQEHTLQT